MAYNNFPAYGSYQPYPTNSYQQQYSQAVQPYQQPTMSYAQPQQTKVGIEWVDGEVGAKAFQLPAGWPANAPMPLWDTNDTVIYLKSINQMGMPNPIQKLKFEFVTPQGQSGNTGEYATKADLERLKKEILEGVKGNAEPAV